MRGCFFFFSLFFAVSLVRLPVFFFTSCAVAFLSFFFFSLSLSLSLSLSKSVLLSILFLIALASLFSTCCATTHLLLLFSIQVPPALPVLVVCFLCFSVLLLVFFIILQSYLLFSVPFFVPVPTFVDCFSFWPV